MATANSKMAASAKDSAFLSRAVCGDDIYDENMSASSQQTERQDSPQSPDGSVPNPNDCKPVIYRDEGAVLVDDGFLLKETYELAEIVDDEIKEKSRSSESNSTNSERSLTFEKISLNSGPMCLSVIAQTAKLALATAEKNTRVKESLRRSSGKSSIGKSSRKKKLPPEDNAADENPASSAPGGLSLDEDVACVDRLLFRTSRYIVAIWIVLILFSYWVAPQESIQWLTGSERNAALVELSILSTAVTMKHGPLLWEMNFMDFSIPVGSSAPWGGLQRRSLMGTPRFSGILVGGLVVQFIAIFTMVIMVSFPVPVMIDPVLKSRVHLLRWCEWTPLAGFMTLMVESIDAPEYDGERLIHHWKRKFFVASMEGLSTLCGLIFPLCPDHISWTVFMVISFVTYFSIFVRYYEKRAAFRPVIRGTSVDEIELYDRSRMSLALHAVCCTVWTMITVMYFVSNAGHLVVSKRWTIFHDPAVTMMEECFMDLVAKILYMSLIIEANHVAFDEAKRANRRLAELKNTMNVVWENSSDTIAISVRKLSGSVTTMVSPSFFRSALIVGKRKILDDISAIVLELNGLNIQRKRDSFTDETTMEPSLSQVGIKIIPKADFAGIDLHSPLNHNAFNDVGILDTLGKRVITFTDMMARAWQSNMDELVFEHDAVLQEDGPRTKFEVKVTRLEENTVVIVVRDVSERYRRFEAEKRFVYETTARQKDAEANRFTRHEVKNGLLAAIEICGNIQEQLSEDFNLLQKDSNHSEGDVFISEHSLSSRVENISELQKTLHEVLDIVLAETVSFSCLCLFLVIELHFFKTCHRLNDFVNFPMIDG